MIGMLSVRHTHDVLQWGKGELTEETLGERHSGVWSIACVFYVAQEQSERRHTGI